MWIGFYPFDTKKRWKKLTVIPHHFANNIFPTLPLILGAVLTSLYDGKRLRLCSDIELDHINIDNMMADTLQYIADGGEVKKESLQLLVDTFHKLTKWYA